MKLINKFTLPALGLVMLTTSCLKEYDVNEGIQNNEASIVKIMHGETEFYPYYFDAAGGEVTLDVLDLRRDAKDPADLNKTNVVVVKADQAALDQYNTDNGTDFQFFTDYEEVAGSIPFDGSNWTATFAPGDFAKLYTIKFDPATLDLSKQYAMAFTITDGGGVPLSATKSKLIVQIAIKNQYQGSYHAVGVFHHPVNGDRPIDEDKELITAGATSVICNLGDLGGSGYQMILNVNPDNTVTITPAGATPNIDQSWGPNYYDPATKSYHLFYSYNVAAPRKVEETITLK